jgi:glycosyltransferase involved in cell wall biosynthesis
VKSLSVVIPAYQSASTLEACLQAVRASSFIDYEIIVVDSASQDETPEIAEKYADQLIRLESKVERSHARSQGAQAAKGAIIVNIDSDVLVRPGTLGLIHAFFKEHPDTDAVTGILSLEHPHDDFFSQYKNLYMHFVFKDLPERVTFLYGSIHAIRREARNFYISRAKVADDTALGQELVSSQRQIAFLKDLEVIHLKGYSFGSWARNDFQIPFDWAKIFIQYKGWRQLGRNKTGFAHASKRQLLSVLTAPAILGFFVAGHAQPAFYLLLGWLVLNSSFFIFLARQKGMAFGFAALGVTFLDHLIMASGIFSGFLFSFIKKRERHGS